ncbi:hypothetical protein MPH_06221 [Macrophomina phaseolina MS6]|uniref:J domain-containing protein n=1 Tax=Macrophomina phaseolina (strain MS6) TaxID=1126212 RepID=K2SHX0_MACPH|nr:hypothetical protein MPH_06221 [Macrophomina phaseolina MS6]
MSSSNKADDLSDEAKELIKSPHDLYALLGLSPSCDEKAIKSAWRKTSLKYHPDKNQDNPSAVETFYLAKNAAELLQNAEARKNGAGTPVKKRVFDGARSAPSTPAGKRPAFSFSPKPGVGGGNKFEQDTLARLKAKQAEKRRLEEQIKAQEAAETTS